MRVLHLNSYDSKGGAARAAHRLHEGCRDVGLDSRMLVKLKESTDPQVDGLYSGRTGWLVSKGFEILDSVPKFRYRQRTDAAFSPAWVSACRAADLERRDPDVIHLHWVTNGFIRPELIADVEASIVWTFHDMWPFTGGCHYTEDCDRYRDRCGECPQLGSGRETDISRKLWNRKKRALEALSVDVVAPSNWLADRIEGSSLFDGECISVIPNPLDTDQFSPRDESVNPSTFGLPPDKRLVLFGGIAATKDPRKGFDLLSTAMRRLARREGADELALVVFGSRLGDEFDLGIETHEVGYVTDDRLPALYALSDVVVVPSRQESFGQTASEALASGTPVAAFRTTGLRDIVDHRRTGYLAEPYDPTDLADGVEWILETVDRLGELSARAREVAVDRYDQRSVAESYADLYRRTING